MKENKPGDRVGAILESDDDTVVLFGYGTYDGDFQPPFLDKEEMAAVVRELMDLPEDEIVEMIEKMSTNPRITLDDGNVIWGMDCYWGDEESVKSLIGSREIVPVDMKIWENDHGKKAWTKQEARQTDPTQEIQMSGENSSDDE